MVDTRVPPPASVRMRASSPFWIIDVALLSSGIQEIDPKRQQSLPVSGLLSTTLELTVIERKIVRARVAHPLARVELDPRRVGKGILLGAEDGRGCQGRVPVPSAWAACSRCLTRKPV